MKVLHSRLIEAERKLLSQLNFYVDLREETVWPILEAFIAISSAVLMMNDDDCMSLLRYASGMVVSLISRTHMSSLLLCRREALALCIIRAAINKLVRWENHLLVSGRSSQCSSQYSSASSTEYPSSRRSPSLLRRSTHSGTAESGGGDYSGIRGKKESVRQWSEKKLDDLWTLLAELCDPVITKEDIIPAKAIMDEGVG